MLGVKPFLTQISRRISDKFRRGAQSEHQLSLCYARVFSATATQDDCQIVLADLANASGFFQVSGPTVSEPERAFADGKRAVMARVMRYVNMPPQMRMQLEQAALMEAQADIQADADRSNYA
jgi:hypothetical protein